ncbi:hypothetical protein B0H13DRAFT_1910303 [Mycena leptocephala]|nr:hypothetical protein B0H13DRAFT_1910303 [Mycena leptocephala]
MGNFSPHFMDLGRDSDRIGKENRVRTTGYEETLKIKLEVDVVTRRVLANIYDGVYWWNGVLVTRKVLANIYDGMYWWDGVYGSEARISSSGSHRVRSKLKSRTVSIATGNSNWPARDNHQQEGGVARKIDSIEQCRLWEDKRERKSKQEYRGMPQIAMLRTVEAEASDSLMERFRPPAVEPKMNQQFSNNKYGRAKECTPSGVLKGRPSLQHNRKTKMIQVAAE